jgi:hypothetical protein
VLSSLLVLTPGLAAQETISSPRLQYSAPVPQQILHARTVFISNGGGSNYYEHFSGGPDRAYNTFYQDLKRTRQYQIVSTPAQADVIFEIRAIAPASSENDTTYYNPQVILTIRDPNTTAVLWRESANVRVFGRRRKRGLELDQAVAVLVDKLTLVTGHSLTDAQTRAIAANSYSRTSAAERIFLFSSLAGAAVITALAIHAAMNHHSLTPPPTPTLP